MHQGIASSNTQSTRISCFSMGPVRSMDRLGSCWCPTADNPGAMPYVTDPNTGYQVWQDDSNSSAPQLGQTQHSGDGGGVPVQTPQQRANAALAARLDPSNPNYVGPGYAAFT